eukprot:6183552-Pleurochrysis_carterae.AAC.2
MRRPGCELKPRVRCAAARALRRASCPSDLLWQIWVEHHHAAPVHEVDHEALRQANAQTVAAVHVRVEMIRTE